MTSRKSISKRNYPSIYTPDGKWYTGFSGSCVTQADLGARERDIIYHSEKLVVKLDVHETKHLELQPSHTRRGRSAANLVFTDREDFEYLLSMKSVDNFLKGLVEGSILIENGYFTAEFCQVKQGQNYFIDLVEENV